MKFPYSMLRDFVSTGLDAEQIGELLTMAGFELEGIEEFEDDAVLEIKVMSNRGDGLSVLGLSREVLAKDLDSQPTALYVRLAAWGAEPEPAAGECPIQIEIQTADCNRYACALFRNVAQDASPHWLRRRLELSGYRCISLLVDLTNYVMLEVGQPLHAFDMDKIQGNQIVVRGSRPGETIITLDGREHSCLPNQMMICDADGPVAVAGIMGGASSEVSESTRNILLESAHFDPISVRKTRKQMELSTEASYRFERSVDPEGVVRAIHRFAELYGERSFGSLDLYPGKRRGSTVSIRVDRANLLLGMSIKEEMAQQYLQRLGMEVAGHGDPFFVVPPSWRPDVVREEDLIEELGRVHGYEQIPELLPKGLTTLGLPAPFYQELDRLRQSVLSHCYTQMASHSLGALHILDRAGRRLGPRTPSSPEYSLLRNSLLPGLSAALQRNGSKNLHLFELGNLFRGEGESSVEWRSMALVSTGELVPSLRKGEPVPTASFYSLKGDIEQVLRELGRTPRFGNPFEPDPRLHPTRQASICIDEVEIGILGQLHPEVCSALRLEDETFAAEIDVDALLKTAPDPLVLKPVSRNPAVRRDIALLIDRSVPFEKIESSILGSAGDVLEKLSVFDEFSGEGIPEGKHSLGIALQLRKMGENFTDEEANRVRAQVVQALESLGGSAR